MLGGAESPTQQSIANQTAKASTLPRIRAASKKIRINASAEMRFNASAEMRFNGSTEMRFNGSMEIRFFLNARQGNPYLVTPDRHVVIEGK
ncbi:hypothetical protein ABZ656_06210 [Streptomyces sp. NPDC007095]|uniref:hypothetical protein n=1 Tax=Streptomyces sp. NPDC007095 TaxID=3154482 RepID=UPI0034104D68